MLVKHRLLVLTDNDSISKAQNLRNNLDSLFIAFSRIFRRIDRSKAEENAMKVREYSCSGFHEYYQITFSATYLQPNSRLSDIFVMAEFSVVFAFVAFYYTASVLRIY